MAKIRTLIVACFATAIAVAAFTVAVMLALSPQPYCPSEDSCVAEYDGTTNRFHVIEVIP